MKHRSAILLSAFFLLFGLAPNGGGKGEGAVTHRPTASAGQSERRSPGGVKAPARGGEKMQAGQRQDTAKSKPAKPRDREGRLTAPNLDQLRQALAQVLANQSGEDPRSLAQRHEGRVSLTLQQSVDIALKSNLSIHIAELTRDVFETEVPRAKALFHPTVGLGLTASGERSFPEQAPVEEVNTQSLTPFITTRMPTGTTLLLASEIGREETSPAKFTTEYGAGISLAVIQPLMRGGRIYVVTKPVTDAEFDVRIEEARLRAEILRVTVATKSLYYTVILTEKVIELTQEAIERDRTLIAASQALLNAGLVSKRDVYSAEISYAKDTARLVSAQANLELFKNDFLDVLGLPIGMEVLLLDKDIGFHPIPLETEKWISAAIANRPEIMEVDERLSKSLLDIRVAKNLLLPQVDLVGSYGRSQFGSTFGRSLDFHGQAWTAGLLFSIPLGNVAAKSNLSRAEIEQARLRQELSQRKRQVELEVRAAAIKLRSSSERMKARGMIVEQARGKMEVSRGRFSLGLATNLDIIDAQEDLLDAETDLLQAVVDYNIAIAELEASIAGSL